MLSKTDPLVIGLILQTQQLKAARMTDDQIADTLLARTHFSTGIAGMTARAEHGDTLGNLAAQIGGG